MAEELVFYTNPMSRGRVARWMLEEVGAPYRTEIIEYGEQMKSPPYTDINPMGKVPAIKHGETVVTENAAICAYLADAFPASGLAPAPGSALRGPYYRWLFFGAGPLEAAWVNQALGVQVPPEQDADGRVRQLRAGAGHAGGGAEAGAVPGGGFQRRGCCTRLAASVRHDVRDDPEAAGVRDVCRAAERAGRAAPGRGKGWAVAVCFAGGFLMAGFFKGESE